MSLLKGVKVIDFTRYFPGPYATLRLADWGAEVIKLESHDGEPGRFLNTYEGAEGSVFRSVNRGKQGAFADLKDAREKERVVRIIEESDVLIEGFRPGVMARLGLDYESVKQVNSGIVYCSLTGYGQTGPFANLSGHDLNYMALSGCLDQLCDETGRPVKPMIALADLVGGVAASEAVLAGLVHRGMTGEGCYLDVSLTEAVLGMMGLHATHASLGGGLHGQMDPSIAYALYQTSDGRFVTLAAMEDKFWRNFCNAIGKPHLFEGKNTLPEESNPYYREVREAIASKDFAYWQEFFERVDCCFAPVLTIEESVDVASFRERGLVGEKWGATYLATHYGCDEAFLKGGEPYPKLD